MLNKKMLVAALATSFALTQATNQMKELLDFSKGLHSESEKVATLIKSIEKRQTDNLEKTLENLSFINESAHDLADSTKSSEKQEINKIINKSHELYKSAEKEQEEIKKDSCGKWFSSLGSRTWNWFTVSETEKEKEKKAKYGKTYRQSYRQWFASKFNPLRSDFDEIATLKEIADKTKNRGVFLSYLAAIIATSCRFTGSLVDGRTKAEITNNKEANIFSAWMYSVADWTNPTEKETKKA
ncbi:MAG: hypothetical protein UR26_C0005G0038 [candidate division TM6 bacterium GW2011_GWF2_32_72]|nr:MAG: hypothetical protein UR26_C0005G0038 [candidate division TM6 bacterium GW2011_GWF2_32_72]